MAVKQLVHISVCFITCIYNLQVPMEIQMSYKNKISPKSKRLIFILY